MKPLTTFARFWYDFIVGDDWTLAAGVVVATTTAVFAVHHGVNAWWILVIGVSALLAASVNVAARVAVRKNTDHLS
jgi:hypothetical protein